MVCFPAESSAYTTPLQKGRYMNVSSLEIPKNYIGFDSDFHYTHLTREFERSRTEKSRDHILMLNYRTMAVSNALSLETIWNKGRAWDPLVAQALDSFGEIRRFLLKEAWLRRSRRKWILPIARNIRERIRGLISLGKDTTAEEFLAYMEADACACGLPPSLPETHAKLLAALKKCW